MVEARFLTSIHGVEADRWDALFPGGNPFMCHAFLAALERSGSVGADTGWQPLHMLLEDGGTIQAVLPLYLKAHSYGEFVFDWGWAEAYRRRGLDYYPKLLSAVPFSPVTGPRIGLSRAADPDEIMGCLIDAITNVAARLNASGWHLLFPDACQQRQLEDSGLAAKLLRREDVRFQWRNRGYRSFDDFLGQLRSSRRKNVRRERRRVERQGIVVQRATGSDISAADWRNFYRCYRATYEKRSGHRGYLNESFFSLLLERMRDQLMLITARRGSSPVGSALFLFDSRRLYGRYWGAVESVDCLHFEACFYQGIEFCIERGLQVFDPGTQGEQKLLRGFEPVRTASFHWLADSAFQATLAGFLQREKRGVSAYEAEARDYLPYRRGPASGATDES